MNLVLYLVTFAVFFAEALFHFNLGKYGTISLSSLSLPDGRELFDIIKVLAIFSGINAYLIPIVQSYLENAKLGIKQSANIN